MNDTISKGSADMGVCTRILFYATPYAITLLCSGFLEIWLLLMPLGTILGSSLPATLRHTRAMVVVDLLLYLLACVLMLGVDEVANQLELPFPHLPLEDMADSALRNIRR